MDVSFRIMSYLSNVDSSMKLRPSESGHRRAWSSESLLIGQSDPRAPSSSPAGRLFNKLDEILSVSFNEMLQTRENHAMHTLGP